jgi:hypothetical protein
MRESPGVVALLTLSLISAVHIEAATKHAQGPLTPFRNTTARGGYIIDTVGETQQASSQNTRLIIRISGADQKLVKPETIALIDKSGAAIKPVFREDRKVASEEDGGSPLSLGGGGASIDLNKLFGPRGDYAYTKVDWPKQVFTADKRLQIVMPGGKSLLLPLTSLAR